MAESTTTEDFSVQVAHLIVHTDGVAALYPHQPPTNACYRCNGVGPCRDCG